VLAAVLVALVLPCLVVLVVLGVSPSSSLGELIMVRTKLKLVGLMLVAAFAILAVAAASASALQWLINGKGLTTATAVKSAGTLLLADLSAPSGGTFIICKGVDTGFVGPGAKDQISTIEAESCKFQEGKNGACTASDPVTATGINLPWLTLLLTVGAAPGTVRDDIFPHPGGGNPGWSVTCTVGGIIKVSDECTSGTGSPVVSNLTTGVGETFEPSETASCSNGNSSSGMVIGTDLTQNPTGGTVSVSNSPNS
jgi:hypothetical protein